MYAYTIHVPIGSKNIYKLKTLNFCCACTHGVFLIWLFLSKHLKLSTFWTYYVFGVRHEYSWIIITKLHSATQLLLTVSFKIMTSAKKISLTKTYNKVLVYHMLGIKKWLKYFG